MTEEAYIRLPEAPPLDKTEILAAVPAPLPPRKATRSGLSQCGRLGRTKNILGICSISSILNDRA
ncbi:hypothetical protein [Bradyrhizobium sp. LMTR 3]|uniref:hypothetical protein n=1 Tax=Bradyrhizobium sp. LMTR 3 TaxID=189873 RepID=UPI00081082F6|nr:hypothetical protein [Bradyrhizobium sp. LMTR 3]OCK57125.1 hypothetical protein LMTR3_35800 [Bradyrhizobium sp. LMTR 3]